MDKNNSKWFVNQLLDAFELAGKESLNLPPMPRLILISIAKYAYRNGKSHVLTSQIEQFCGISASNQNKYFKILKERKFLSITRKFTTTKEGKKLTKNTYQIHLDVIINLSINQDSGEISVNNTCVNIEPSVPRTNRSSIEPSVPRTSIKPTLVKANQKQELIDIVHPVQILSNVKSLPVDAYFEDFWACYPRKEKKEMARKIWIREGLDRLADGIIDDVRQRQIRHDRWEDRSYIPLPTTYLNNEGWKDEIIERKKLGAGHANGKFDSATYLVDKVRKSYEQGKSGYRENVFDVANYLSKKVD